MSGKIDKDGVYKFLRRLQHELGNTFYDLKDDFEKTPPSNNQIRQRFLVRVHRCRNGKASMISWLYSLLRKCTRSTKKYSTSGTSSSRLRRIMGVTLNSWCRVDDLGTLKRFEQFHRGIERLYPQPTDKRSYDIRYGKRQLMT